MPMTSKKSPITMSADRFQPGRRSELSSVTHPHDLAPNSLSQGCRRTRVPVEQVGSSALDLPERHAGSPHEFARPRWAESVGRNSGEPQCCVDSAVWYRQPPTLAAGSRLDGSENLSEFVFAAICRDFNLRMVDL